ncbi:rod shape-determining protein MreD [Trichlorobacter sp.]|uniref:rod shape-determining protein MreD n=1 Tax=Trichlorobacter sp. TaxID=2911007 RepID=UPI002A35CB4A|nr:rod shape-determining protein MreD [Trichlorobacter sp.]MDY0383514.1 rod shape-determining protein MreD [Trichlorobacter sp.]
MRAFLKALCIVVAVVAFQSAVLPHYLEPAFKPDLLLVLMVFLALRAETSVSLPAAYGLGLLKDCLSGIYLGLNAFSFLVVYLVLKSVSERLNVQSCLLFVLTVSAATAASAAINLLLLLVFSQTPTLFAALLNQLLPHLLVNAFVASLVAAVPGCGSLRTSP